MVGHLLGNIIDVVMPVPMLKANRRMFTKQPPNGLLVLVNASLWISLDLSLQQSTEKDIDLRLLMITVERSGVAS